MIKFSTTFMNCLIDELYSMLCYFVNDRNFNVCRINIIPKYNATELIVVFNGLSDYVIENLIDKWQRFNDGNWHLSDYIPDIDD